MIQRWEQLSFLHWPVEAAAVAHLLPPGLDVDTFDGAAWVGLIPFRLTVRLPWTPPIPWVSTFAEANVRTYVRGPDGRRGIWFLSLDAARLAAVLVARTSYRLPYLWACASVARRSGAIRYTSIRRWPGSTGAGFQIAVAPGPQLPASELSDLERFLVFRWRLYTPARMKLPPDGLRIAATQVDHPPWPVHRARLLELRQNLVDAAGVRVSGDPLVHFSPGVEVRFGGRESCS
jgi:uncharacterized protein YqjF (DUF2071 family)